MDPNDDYLPESSLLEVSGLKLEDVRRLRNGRYRCGVDWERRQRGMIWWKKTAATALMRQCGINAPLDEKNAASGRQCANLASSIGADEPPAWETIELEVWKGPAEGILNKIMVEAHKKGVAPASRADLLRVIVRDNRGMTRGKLIWARQREGDLYELAPPPRKEVRSHE
jgi:hypothetical protein